MATPESTRIEALARSARRAYELGRLRMALLHAWPVPPMLAVAAVCCGRETTFGVGLALLAGLILLRWLGAETGRAATAGLVAGLPPFLLPILLRSSGVACLGGVCLPSCLAGCAVGGLLAMLILAGFARSATGSTGRYLLAAGGIAALTGGLGCLVMGGPGLAAMAAGALLASPALILAPRNTW